MPQQQHGRLIRFYRRLTALYPRPFRDEFESELVEAMQDRALDRPQSAFRLALDMIVDIFTTAPKEHWYMLQQDLRHAFRLLAKTPIWTIAVISILAIGIGSTTTVFSLVHAVLLRPLPFDHPDQLAFIDEAAEGIDHMGPSYPNLLDYQQAKKFTSIAAYTEGGISLTGSGEPERVDGAWVSHNLFETLGVRPLLGRNFSPEEDQPKQESATMLSYGLWQRRFAGDPAIVGRAIQINGKARTVVGVMPSGFRFPETAELWGPLAIDPKREVRTNHFLTVVGRSQNGVTIAQSRDELTGILRGIQNRFPNETSELRVVVTPLRDRLTGDYRTALILLLSAVALVLAIACTNIMNLLLARAVGRTREVAIRTALGANRRRIIRQLLTESLLLGIVGCLLGLGIAVVLLRVLTTIVPIELPYWIVFKLDPIVCLFALSVTAGSVLLFGMIPAWQASRINPSVAMNELRRGVTAGQRAARLRQVLVCAQVALSVVLLVAAGVMLKSFVNLNKSDLGFQNRDALAFRIALPATRYSKGEARETFFTRMREQLAAVPGVRSVATSTSIPLGGNRWWRTVQHRGETRTRPNELPLVFNTMVSPGYFQTLGIPLQKGRDFDRHDDAEHPAIIVSERLAKQLWPAGDAIGQQVRVDPFLPEEKWRTVVGVAGDVHLQGAREPAPPAIYVPEMEDTHLQIAVLVSSSLPPASLVSQVRAQIRALDAELPLFGVQPLNQVVSRASWSFQFYTILFSAFGAAAVILATVGLSGIMVQLVADRTHEIGVRMALGASRGDVVRMIVQRSTLLMAVGTALGAIASVATTRSLETLLFGVSPNDIATLAGVLAVIVMAALLATWSPANRASRIEPATALRQE